MKRALIYSLIFHIILFSFVFFLKEQRSEQKLDYFHTRLISPEELKEFQDKKTLIPPKKIPPSSAPPNLRTLPQQKKKEIAKDIPKKLDQQHVSPPSPTEKTGREPLATENLGKIQEPKIQPKDIPASRLFDKEIIGKLAQKEKETKPDSSITFSTKEFQYQGYMQRLKEKIEGIWRYPRDAAERGIYGDLYIRFTILKNGRLGAIELIRTSGYKSLDDAAIKALRDAEPYWPLPDEWGKDGLTITGHFVYTYYGSYIR